MDDIIPENTPQKQCTKCLQPLPATSEFFSHDGRNRDGFHHFCKKCINTYNRGYNKEGPTKKSSLPDGYKQCNQCKKILPATSEYFFRDKHRLDGFVSYCKEHNKRIRKGSIANGIKTCPRCKRELPATSEYFYARSDRTSGLKSKCIECDKSVDAQRERPKASKEENRQRYLIERVRRLQQREVYYHRHVGDYQRYHQQYRQTHIEQVRAHGHNRRARQRGAPGKHNATDIKKLFTNQQGKCYYCKVALERGKHGYHVDHVVPLSRGGSNWPDNLVIACAACNLSKKDKLPHEWPKGGRLL